MKNLIKVEEYYFLIKEGIPTHYYYDDFIKKIKHTNGAEYGYAEHVYPVIASTNLNMNSVYFIDINQINDLLKNVYDDICYNLNDVSSMLCDFSNALMQNKFKGTMADCINSFIGNIINELEAEVEMQAVHSFDTRSVSFQELKAKTILHSITFPKPAITNGYINILSLKKHI